MDHPVDFSQLPEASRRALGGPAPLKMMVARGMAPLPPAALVSALYGLAYNREDVALRDAAAKTLGALPDAVLNGALGTADLHPAVLDDLAARFRTNRAVLERVVRHGQTAGETIATLARTSDEELSEIIATNEQRLLANPEIIEALYMNEHTRMSTADRIVELAARNGLTVNIRGFDNIVAALNEQGGRGATAVRAEPVADERQADAEFRVALELAKDLEGDAVREEEDGTLKLNEQGDKVDKSIAKMTITEKIRTAMLGNAGQRALLIRSPNRLVFSAVLDSPKIQEDEILKFSASRQVSADVLRRISMDRGFTRLYDVKLNLVNNPKTPLTDGMRFLPHLREPDMRKLLGNKNIASGLRNAVMGMLANKKKK